MARRLPAMLRLFAAVLFVAVTGPLPDAWANDPSLSPFLRLDVGRHIAPVTRMATDRDETVLVTASLDKTLRLWSPETGALKGVLRVPIGHGWEGGLYAVAVSPDGKTLLTGGMTGDSWSNPYWLYRFDLETMKINGLLSNMKGVINDIAWSPDGRFVALGLGGSGHVEVRDAAGLKLVARDSDYTSHVTSVSFDEAGRLAAVADDGMLRLYAANSFELLGKVKLRGAHPASVRLSRDGARIAVGSFDRNQADVYDGRSLKHLTAASLKGLEQGEANIVGWVARPGGGEELVAGGTLSAGTGRFAVRRWQDGSKVQDVVVAGDSVSTVLPSRQGGYFFASADSSWGRVDDRGTRIVSVERVTADFRDADKGRLALSPNGLGVAFRLHRGADTVYRFDLVDRVLSVQPGAPGAAVPGVDAAFAPTEVPNPGADAKALRLTDWRNQPRPKLGKRVLTLGTGELARSVAALPGGQGFVLGADYSLRLFDRSGTEVRMVELPAAAWTVAVSKDGRFAVAALADGTLRWYNLGPQRPPLGEVVSFFAHRDGVRWVAWTPEGFFDQSREGGGGDLVGFHLNVGRGKTEWMEFERAYRIFYNSEMVTAKLDPARDAEIAQRLALVGDLRQRVAARPEVRILDYCYGGAVETRGVKRADAPMPTAAPAAGGPGVVCVPAHATRGVARVAPTATGAPAATGTTLGAVAPGDGADAVVPNLPHDVTQVRLRFAVKGADGYGAIQVYRNGRNASDQALTRGVSRVAADAPPAARALPPLPAGVVAAGEDVHESSVVLDSGRNAIEVQVFDKTGGTDRRTNPLILVRAEPPARDLQAVTKPRMFLLVAGINAYKGDAGGFGALRLARSDARNFADTIWTSLPPSYDKSASVLTQLYDGQANRTAIIDAVTAFREQAGPDDLIVIYLSGHGVAVPSAADPAVTSYYFITPEVVGATDEDIRTKALSSGDLVEALANARTGNLLLVLDTCQAGQFAKSEFDKVKKEIGNPNIWAASTSTQFAADEYPGSGHGLFFHAISEAITDKVMVDEETRIVPLRAVGYQLETIVPILAKSMRYTGRQKPVIIQPQGDGISDSLPLAMRSN